MKNALGSALLRLEMHEQRVVIISRQRIDRVERVGKPRVVLAFGDADHIMPVLFQFLHQPRGQPARVHKYQPGGFILLRFFRDGRDRQYRLLPDRDIEPIGNVLLLSQYTLPCSHALDPCTPSLNPVSLSLKRIPRQLHSSPLLLSSSPFPFSHSPSTPITHSFPTARLISSSSPPSRPSSPASVHTTPVPSIPSAIRPIRLNVCPA